MIDSLPDNHLDIKVSDPVKQGGTVGGYITYKLTTNSNMEGMISGESIVDRRYSDFVWLFERITKEFPAVLVPALPEKQTFGFSAMGFNKVSQIDSRKRGLEKFLERCATHHQLRTSPSLHSFLCDTDSLFETTKKQMNADASAAASSGKKDPLAWMEKKYNSLANSSKKTELEKTSTDEKMEEIDDYLIVLLDLMQKISKSATLLVKRDRQVAEATFLFSQALGELGQAEDGSVSNALIQFGSSIDQLSQSTTKLGEQELIQVDEPLQEYVRVMQGLQKALKRRAQMRKDYQAALYDLDYARAAYQKVEGTNHPDEGKKEQGLENAQKFCDEKKDAFERVSSELLEEFVLFKANKAPEIKGILTKWMDLNITYCVRAKQTWNELGPTAESIYEPGDDREGGEDYMVHENPILNQQHQYNDTDQANSNPFGSASAPDLPSAPAPNYSPHHGGDDDDVIGV